jgi:phage terminase large subunit
VTRTLEIQLPYSPLPKQAEAHGLATKYRGFCGGWGNGKTSWGCAETFTTLMEFPGTNCIIARKTRPELKATTWDMFINGDPGQPTGWHGIPQELIKSHNRTELFLELITPTPGVLSRVWGLPLDDPRKLENFNLGFFWIDQAEEVEEDIFLKFHGRLRQLHGPREGILTFNPNGHNYLYRRMIDPNRPESFRTQYACVEATTFDNPNLPADYFDQFSGLPDAWLQRFVYGSHDVFVGQIFTDYDPDTHVIQPFHIPKEWQRFGCIDPGIRHEGALSWIARDFDGNVYYYREHLEPNRDVSWWANKIYASEAKADWGGPEETMYNYLIGPEAQQRAQTDGKSVLDLFYGHGIFPEIADKDPVARISKITEYLRPLEGHRNPFTGESPAPRLYIFSDCDKLQDYLPQYRWRPQRTNFSEEEAPEKPRKKDDHNIDNLGHILLQLEYIPIPEHDDENPAPRDVERRMVKDLMDESWEQAARDSLRSHDVLSSV